ncbi:hypothetical protein [Nonomuraea wenchangensis]
MYTLDDLELLLGDDPDGRRYLNKLQFGQVRFLPTSEPQRHGRKTTTRV